MPEIPRRIVTGHDDSGKSVVLSDGPTPKTLDIGTAVFHELWATAAMPVPIAAAEPEPTTRPLRTPPDANAVAFGTGFTGRRRWATGRFAGRTWTATSAGIAASCAARRSSG